MKHKYEDYIEFVDGEITRLNDLEKYLGYTSLENSYYRASLLANKATLERHKGRPSRQSDFAFPAETEEIRAKQEALRYCCVCRTMTCPSLLDVTNQLDEVFE